MAAYGIILAMVAEFPLHKLRNPSCFILLSINLTAPRNEYRLSLDTEEVKKKIAIQNQTISKSKNHVHLSNRY